MKLKQYNLPEDFAEFLADAEPAGNFIGVETLFGDFDYFRREEQEVVASALVAAAADLYSPEDTFIDDETTTTEVYFEAYRRCFFDEQYSKRYGSESVFRSVPARLFILAHLRHYLENALNENGSNGPNVIQFLGRTVH